MKIFLPENSLQFLHKLFFKKVDLNERKCLNSLTVMNVDKKQDGAVLRQLILR